MGHSAHAEAIAHLQHGLEALNAMPASQDRDRREIGLRSLLSMSLGMIRGLSAPEVEAVHERMLTLTGQLGDDVPLGIYFGLWNFYASRGKLQTGARSGAAAPRARRGGRRRRVAPGRPLYAAAADAFLGRLAEARDGFERLLASYPKEASPTRRWPTTSASSAQSLLGDTLWLLGRAEEATRMADEAIAQARRCSPFTLSVALVDRMILATSMRDAATSRQRAQELIALSSEHSYQYLGRALAHLTGADWHLGRLDRHRDRSRAAGSGLGDRADAHRVRQQPPEQPLPRLDGVRRASTTGAWSWPDASSTRPWTSPPATASATGCPSCTACGHGSCARKARRKIRSPTRSTPPSRSPGIQGAKTFEQRALDDRTSRIP